MSPPIPHQWQCLLDLSYMKLQFCPFRTEYRYVRTPGPARESSAAPAGPNTRTYAGKQPVAVGAVSPAPTRPNMRTYALPRTARGDRPGPAGLNTNTRTYAGISSREQSCACRAAHTYGRQVQLVGATAGPSIRTHVRHAHQPVRARTALILPGRTCVRAYARASS